MRFKGSTTTIRTAGVIPAMPAINRLKTEHSKFLNCFIDSNNNR